MSYRKLISLLAVAGLSAPVSAHAISALAFDNARVVEPNQWESGGGFTFGAGGIVYGFGSGRLGLLEDLEAQLRAGMVGFDGEAGFEIETGAKFRFLRMQDTGGALDVAFVGMGSILKTGDVFVFGLDPSILASHEFNLSASRRLFVSAHVGLSLTFQDVEGKGTDTDPGLLGGMAVGVDVVESVRLSLEGRIRDDDDGRAGVSLTYLF